MASVRHLAKLRPTVTLPRVASETPAPPAWASPEGLEKIRAANADHGPTLTGGPRVFSSHATADGGIIGIHDERGDAVLVSTREVYDELELRPTAIAQIALMRETMADAVPTGPWSVAFEVDAMGGEVLVIRSAEGTARAHLRIDRRTGR